jgi:hypothetical protein
MSSMLKMKRPRSSKTNEKEAKENDENETKRTSEKQHKNGEQYFNTHYQSCFTKQTSKSLKMIKEIIMLKNIYESEQSENLSFSLAISTCLSWSLFHSLIVI